MAAPPRRRRHLAQMPRMASRTRRGRLSRGDLRPTGPAPPGGVVTGRLTPPEPESAATGARTGPDAPATVGSEATGAVSAPRPGSTPMQPETSGSGSEEGAVGVAALVPATAPAPPDSGTPPVPATNQTGAPAPRARRTLARPFPTVRPLPNDSCERRRLRGRTVRRPTLRRRPVGRRSVSRGSSGRRGRLAPERHREQSHARPPRIGRDGRDGGHGKHGSQRGRTDLG